MTRLQKIKLIIDQAFSDAYDFDGTVHLDEAVKFAFFELDPKDITYLTAVTGGRDLKDCVLKIYPVSL